MAKRTGTDVAKLFCCDVSITLYIYADDEGEADRLAREYASEEASSVVNVTKVDADHKIHSGWVDAIPYDQSDDTTVGERVAQMKDAG